MPRIVHQLGLCIVATFLSLAHASANQSTLAILPFENNSITDRDTYAPLSAGLSAMLTSDLAKSPDLKMIERAQIVSMLKEIALGQSGVIDDSTAIRAGRMLGAQHIAFGSFVVLGSSVRIDARIIKVETTELIEAESVEGNTKNFLSLQRSLGEKIARALAASYRPDRARGGNIDGALLFSQGVNALDAGDRVKAESLFSDAVKRDASLKSRVASALSAPVPAAASKSTTDANTDASTVTVEGYSMKSSEDAIESAQRMAVEQAMGVMVSSETEMENYQLKKDRVISRSYGYITSYDTLDSRREPDGTYIVKIKAIVSLKKIQDDLAAMDILLDRMDRPRVMVMVEEDYFNMDDLGLNLAETEVVSLLNIKGFDLVDPAQVQRVLETEKSRQAMAGNAAAAQSIGLENGAQYVVIGKAVVSDNGEAVAGAGLKSMQASMQLRIVQTQSGLVLGSATRTGVAAHISAVTGATNALRNSAEKAVNEYVANTITEAFQDFVNNGAPLRLQINGVTSFSLASQVTKAIDAVENVATNRRDGWKRDSGLLTLNLRFRGTSETLAEALDGLAIGRSKLAVTDYGPDRLECVLE